MFRHKLILWSRWFCAARVDSKALPGHLEQLQTAQCYMELSGYDYKASLAWASKARGLQLLFGVLILVLLVSRYIDMHLTSSFCGHTRGQGAFGRAG